MKRMIFTAAAGLLVAGTTEAITVRFDDLDRAAGDQLRIRGVVISGNGVATVKGHGLGVEGGYSSGSIDRNIYVPGGGQPDDVIQRSEYIEEIFVPGVIRSVTILPHYEASTEEAYPAGGPVFWMIQPDYAVTSFWLFPGDITGLREVIVDTQLPENPPKAHLNEFYNRMMLAGPVFHEDSAVWYWGMNQINGGLETHYSTGFSIVSIDYIPIVDAGSTAVLLGFAIGGLFVFRNSKH